MTVHASNMVLQSIDVAAGEECDILVFPENCIPPSTLQPIKNKLGDPSIRGRIKLVVAGSTWHPSDDGASGDNVCHLLDGAGHEIGRCYKRAAFESGSIGSGYVEALANPGHEVTIVDVENLGRVVVGICRDLSSDARYVVDLARDFEAQIAIIPAMSKSVDRAFKEQAENAASQLLVSTVVCNYCGVRPKVGEDGAPVDIGLATVPARDGGKNPKKASSHTEWFTKDRCCQGNCRKSYESGEPTPCLMTACITADKANVGLAVSTAIVSKTDGHNGYAQFQQGGHHG